MVRIHYELFDIYVPSALKKLICTNSGKDQSIKEIKNLFILVPNSHIWKVKP